MLAAKPGFIDGIRLGHSVTRILNAGLYLSNGNAKFGTTSLFGGSAFNSIIRATPFNDFAFGTGNFTLEFWFNPTSVAFAATMLGFRPASGNGAYPCIYMNTNGVLTYYVFTADRITSPVNAIVANTWQSIAVVRTGTQTKMYLNGNQVGVTYTDTTNYLAGSCTIGANDYTANGSYQIRGYMDELRISNVARYTANYTPATQPFVDDANTLLLCHFDGANNSIAFVDDNT